MNVKLGRLGISGWWPRKLMCDCGCRCGSTRPFIWGCGRMGAMRWCLFVWGVELRWVRA